MPAPKPEQRGSQFKELFFPIGLLITLIFAYSAIEFKTYVKSYDEIVGEILQDDTDDIIITVQNLPPPPPPPPPPVIVEVFEVVEDEAEVEETFFASTETDQEEVVEDVEYEEIEEEFGDIPFTVVEVKPSFPLSTPSMFQRDIQNHVRKHFRYPQTALELGVQGRVFIQFIILKDGSIKIKNFRGPDKRLEKEAVRIINKLPKMKPGEQRGTPVNVPFSIPITFRLSV